MKAIVCEKYGSPDVLQLKEIEKPTPKDNEVLIKINATSVSAADYRIRGLNVPTGFGIIMRLAMGFSGPRNPVLGAELAGVIESTGKDVKTYKVGDRVFALSGINAGAYAEYLCMKEDKTLTLMPATMSFQEAAVTLFGAHTALSFLRDKGNIQSGQKVLINGASGAVGTAAVQIAKVFGAGVTGVCSTANIEMVKSLGADYIIDYSTEKLSKSHSSYDIIFDTVGNLKFSQTKKMLNSNGRHITAVAGIPQYLQMLINSIGGSKKYMGGIAGVTKEDLNFIRNLIEKGKLKSVIDRCYPIEQIVDAHRYAEKGHKKGNVVITLSDDSDIRQSPMHKA